MKKISQAQAARYARRADELEEKLRGQRSGRKVGSVQLSERGYLLGRIEMARDLGYAVLLSATEDKTLHFTAVKV